MLVRSCVHPIAVVGDLKQAFLRVWIRETVGDALQFHRKQGEHSEIETLRFTRALFGVALAISFLSKLYDRASPGHLEAREPHIVAELWKSPYMDDLISGGTTVEKAKELKERAIEIFEDALQYTSGNQVSPNLQEHPILPVGTFAKQQLGELSAGGSRNVMR